MLDFYKMTLRRRIVQQLLTMFPHYKNWPRRIVKIFFSTKPDNQGRFIMTVFFMNNGLPPEKLKHMYVELYPDLDAAAWRQINWIIRQYPTNRWTSWMFNRTEEGFR